MENPKNAVQEIYRVLKCGGIGLFTVPFLCSIHGDYWEDRKRWTATGHKELIGVAKFKEIEIIEMGSLGCVIWDLLHVALGYSSKNPNGLKTRILRKILHLSKPFFRWIDNQCESQKKFISSGYFIIAKK